MKTIIISLFSYLTLTVVNAGYCQGIPSNSPLILYELDRTPGKYLLCANFQTERNTIFHSVVGDTFAVKPKGGMCFLLMSNAYILKTQYRESMSNEVVQYKMWVDASWIGPFPPDKKVVFNGSIVDLSKLKTDPQNASTILEGSTNVYQGKAALDQLKKMGLPPPDDMDEKKAVGP